MSGGHALGVALRQSSRGLPSRRPRPERPLLLERKKPAGIRTRLRTVERAAFVKGYADRKFKNLIQGGSGTPGSTATRLEAYVASSGMYSYGRYPEIDAIFHAQATEIDRSKREALLHRIQEHVHEKAMFAPLWELVTLNGVGARVEQSGLGLIAGYPYSAPYEDVTLKLR